jgi:hypothetical protein
LAFLAASCTTTSPARWLHKIQQREGERERKKIAHATIVNKCARVVQGRAGKHWHAVARSSSSELGKRHLPDLAILQHALDSAVWPRCAELHNHSAGVKRQLAGVRCCVARRCFERHDASTGGSRTRSGFCSRAVAGGGSPRSRNRLDRHAPCWRRSRRLGGRPAWLWRRLACTHTSLHSWWSSWCRGARRCGRSKGSGWPLRTLVRSTWFPLSGFRLRGNPCLGLWRGCGRGRGRNLGQCSRPRCWWLWLGRRRRHQLWL